MAKVYHCTSHRVEFRIGASVGAQAAAAIPAARSKGGWKRCLSAGIARQLSPLAASFKVSQWIRLTTLRNWDARPRVQTCEPRTVETNEIFNSYSVDPRLVVGLAEIFLLSQLSGIKKTTDSSINYNHVNDLCISIIQTWTCVLREASA